MRRLLARLRFMLSRFDPCRRPVYDVDWSLVDRQRAAKAELPGDPYLGAMAREARIAASRARREIDEDRVPV